MNFFALSIIRHIEQCAADTRIENDISPFPIAAIPSKKIAFHLIDLNTWQYLQNDTDGNFFARLSGQYAQQGWRLVHLWEDVWRRRKELVESRINIMLGLFVRYHARKMEARSIDSPALKNFLRQHHLLEVIGGRYRYGLFLNSDMMATASFSGACPFERNGRTYRSHELLRYASRSGCVIAGGMGKLAAHFIREKQPDDIMTYIDTDWGCGDGLRQLGFEWIDCRLPQKFWMDRNFIRHYTEFGSNATMLWNSGSWKFVRDCRMQTLCKKSYVESTNKGGMR